jgi:hypothetical protein
MRIRGRDGARKRWCGWHKVLPKAQVARECGVHLNSVKAWIGRTVRSPSCGAAQEIIPGGGGTVATSGAGRRRHGETPHAMHARAADPLLAQPNTVARWLKAMGFSYKRYRTSVKKSAMPRQWRASGSNLKH